MAVHPLTIEDAQVAQKDADEITRTITHLRKEDIFFGSSWSSSSTGVPFEV